MPGRSTGRVSQPFRHGEWRWGVWGGWKCRPILQSGRCRERLGAGRASAESKFIANLSATHSVTANEDNKVRLLLHGGEQRPLVAERCSFKEFRNLTVGFVIPGPTRQA